MDDRKRRIRRPDRRVMDAGASKILPITADLSNGFANLATKPRAGNISTDMRAGRAA